MLLMWRILSEKVFVAPLHGLQMTLKGVGRFDAGRRPPSSRFQSRWRGWPGVPSRRSSKRAG